MAPLRQALRATRGFSLVEVVLALGVISVAVVSLLGLLAISTGSSRLSDEDTVIAAIVRQVDTELHNTAFSNLPSSGVFWYFDNEGHRVTTDLTGKAVYQCQINLTGDASYDFPKGTPNLYRVELLFSHAFAPKAPILQVVTTTLPRND